MRRLLLSLYVVIVAVPVASALSFAWLWDHGLRTELVRSAEQTALGAQFMLELELRGVPVTEWPERIEEVRRHFGYEVTLLRLAEIAGSDRNLQRLRQGLPALDEGAEIKYMLLPLRGSDYVVRVYIVQQEDEDAARSIQGFYYLLERQLADASPQQRIDWLQAVEQQFEYPIRSVPLSDIPEETDRNRVRAGEIIAVDFDLPEERFYKLLPGEDRALQIGPFPRYFLERNLEYGMLLAFALAVGFALYLWVRPLWRDMLALERGAQAIGQGKLDTRVEVATRSAIRGVAETFNGMAQRVQELLRAQKEMTDAVSHELRTPISRMRFGVEMLERTTVPGDRERYLQAMHNSLDELEALVDESLTYSRLTGAARRLSPQTIDLARWLAEIIDDAHPFAGEVRLSSEVHPGDARAHMDAKLVARALKNIVRNALRHARTTVKVVIRQDALHTTFTVEDDGPGIPAEQRAAIFEPFYRIDNSRQRGSGGHGLGLAIVQRICEWTNAEISVADSFLGGALFRLRWITRDIAPVSDGVQ
ncbi:ATP-binding protein [Steroidobacter sp. S1-65]|uniref:histidine kinase n=1 Tax=Steroidobacter gossypii TaxID=2805490 RepID=A0ABS1X2D8_9GAMM|nr:ATP-binding protein [Steroidobacter gossypii]MBM0107388.1 ATP-binding protein [Steroidobacter gossypii]